MLQLWQMPPYGPRGHNQRCRRKIEQLVWSGVTQSQKCQGNIYCKASALAPSSGSLYSCNFRDRATQNPASHSFNINSPPVSSRLIPGESTGKKRRLLLRTGDMTTSQREIRLVLPHVETASTELAELNPIKDTSCHDIALCISEVCMLGKIGAGSYDNYQGRILFPVRPSTNEHQRSAWSRQMVYE